MDPSPRITYICLNVVNILLHGLGFCFLLLLYKKGQRSSQRIYLLNLSLVELLQNLLRLLVHSIVLQRMLQSHNTIGKVGQCILNVTNSGMYYLCFMSVLLLTGDRLLCVGFKYAKAWSIEKCINILKCTWTFNVMISVAMVLFTYFYLDNIELSRRFDYILTVYIPTTLFITFLVFAVVTYSIMFSQFFTSSRVTQRNRTASQSSIMYTFSQSKFFMSLIIITAFLVLMVIPGLIATIKILHGKPLERWYQIYLNISVTLNDTADGLIYVFFQPDVKRLLITKIGELCRNKRNSYMINQRTTFEISGSTHTCNAMLGDALTSQGIEDVNSMCIINLNYPLSDLPPNNRIEHYTSIKGSIKNDLQCSEPPDVYKYNGGIFYDSSPDDRLVISSMSLRLPPFPHLSTFQDLSLSTHSDTDEENITPIITATCF